MHMSVFIFSFGHACVATTLETGALSQAPLLQNLKQQPLIQLTHERVTCF